MGQTCASTTGKDEDFICEAGAVHRERGHGDEQVIEGLRYARERPDRLEPPGLIRSSARRVVTAAMTTLAIAPMRRISARSP